MVGAVGGKVPQLFGPGSGARQVACGLHAVSVPWKANAGGLALARPDCCLMSDRPDVRYAVDRSGTHVSFQRFGAGPPLLLLAGWATNLDGMWREPGLALFLRRLGAMRSVVMFDKRGVGLSDPAPDVSNAGDAMKDVLVVLDACEVDAVEVLAAAEASFVAVPLAAFHPERVRSLVMVNGTAKTLAESGYPEGIAMSAAKRYSHDVGSSAPRLGLSVTAPSRADDPSFRRWAAEYQRAIASPGVSRRIISMVGQADVRGLLGSVRCPTVVLHRKGDQFYSVGAGRVMAAGIPGAQFVEVNGADHLFWVGDVEPLFAAVEQVGSRGRTDAGERRLGAVMFVDIVDSTVRAAELGDAAWSVVLDTVEDLIERAVREHSGRLVKFLGDGALAVFDAPVAAVRAADRIREEMRLVDLSVRCGVHCGEIERRGADIGGIAVAVAARVAATASGDQIVATALAGELCFGAQLVIEPLGDHKLKGLDLPVALVAIDLPHSSHPARSTADHSNG